MYGDGKPNELSKRYLEDVDTVIGGLADGTAVEPEYMLCGNEDDVGFSIDGGVVPGPRRS